jgi:hypothetical protein
LTFLVLFGASCFGTACFRTAALPAPTLDVTLPGCHSGRTFQRGQGCPDRGPGTPTAGRHGDPISVRDDVCTMTVFLVLLIPVLLMVFALFMERVENRLRTRTVSEADVQEFLDTARPEEVNTFIREGWTRAFDKFRLRRRPLFRRKNGNRTKSNGPRP